MAKDDIDASFRRIKQLVEDIDRFAPAHDPQAIGFRSNLAGLLVVLISATYENCVKETLISYASKHGSAFENFVINHYDKLSSRIRINDLKSYARTFDESTRQKLDALLRERSDRLSRFTGQDIVQKYNLILDWRHAFAHAGTCNTTVEEAFETHRLAKHVLYLYEEALNGP